MQWSRTYAQVLFEFVNGSIMDEIFLRGILCASQKSISMDKYYLTINDMILLVTYLQVLSWLMYVVERRPNYGL